MSAASNLEWIRDVVKSQLSIGMRVDKVRSHGYTCAKIWDPSDEEHVHVVNAELSRSVLEDAIERTIESFR